MYKANCWEVKKCEREPGGENVDTLGVCPAAIDEFCNDLNSGKNGGRICWAIAGTLCGGKIQGDYALKQATCLSCEFYKRVKEEEGTANFLMLKPGQEFKLSE